MDNLQKTIERLRALDFVGKDSYENLSAICFVLYDGKPEYGWTMGACSTLRETLVGWLEQYDPADWADVYLAEQGLVRLPVDADGEVIHVGDEVQDKDGKVDVVMNFTLHHNGTWSIRTFGTWVRPDELTHYHAPTIEDVLREFWGEVGTSGDAHLDELVAEYADKVREVMADE